MILLPWECLMFSNKQFKIVLTVWTMLPFLSGCSQFFEKKKSMPEKEESYVINVKEAENLKEVPGLFALYFKDALPAEKIDIPFRNIRSALSAFARYTRGENEGFYTSTELQKFLNKYLLKQNQISDEFMQEIMRLKVLGVGGSNETLTRYELQKLDELLVVTTEKARSARGWMRLLLFQLHRDSLTQLQLDQAEALLEDLVQSFVSRTKLVGSNYEFNNFKDFVRHLGGFLGEPESFAKFRDWMPMLEVSKNLFLGELSRAKSPAEFRALATWITKVYGLGIRVYYQIESLDLESTKAWPELLANLDRALGLLQDAPVVKEGGGLAVAQIDQLIDQLTRSQLFQLKLDTELLKTTYRKFVLFVLESRSTSRRSLSELISINGSHISVLREEYEVWKASQTFLIREFQSQSQKSYLQLTQNLSRHNLGPLVSKLDAPKRQIVLQSWQDFVKLLNQRPATVLDIGLRLQIGPQSLTSQVNYKSATIMNALRSVTRMVLKAYGDGKTSSVQLFGQNITQDGMVHFEQDFQDFGRAVRFLDPRIEGPAKRAFKEGNFFAFHGNGDELLSSTELYELFCFMISAGLSGAHQVQKDLDQKPGCLTGRTDPFDENIATASCFMEVFNANFQIYLGNTPGLADFVSKLNASSLRDFMETLIYVS